MRESKFVSLLKKNLKGVFHKNHGSAYGTAGLPDLEGCLPGGKSIVIEAKMGKLKSNGEISLRSPLTTIQKFWLSEYHKYGAVSIVVVYLENIHKIVFLPYPFELYKHQRLTDINFLTTFLSSEIIESKVVT